ncbi:MAG TPA: DsbC family protein [Smithella sp.]|nr:DsbC family protein [Smithella sp.]
MKKILLSVMMCAMIIVCASAFAGTAVVGKNVEKKLKAAFPDLHYDSIAPSPVKGIYEVVWGTNLYYFAPQEGILINGQMYDKTKHNLTADRQQAIMEKFNEGAAEKAKSLPLDKAVKIGHGKHIVIEFTDPDCPYCRQAAKFFESRNDITKYTFFTPLPMHPDAPNKVRYILCQKDPSKALVEVMQGKIDGQKYETCKNPEVDDQIKLDQAMSQKMGVSSTPYFIIDGKVVSGADIPKIESLLGDKGDKTGEKK